MTEADWRRVLDEAAALGVHDVQFIGGEPTLYPDLPELVRHALRLGQAVEVYSNLVRVTDALWEVFELPGVRLATSYYSPDAGQHDAITGRRSHDRTLANIHEALRRRIPLRVGLVDVDEGQDVAAALAELDALGIENVTVDRLRGVGRGVRNQEPGVDQLCGKCANGSLAVLPTGAVVPCVFARWMVLGDVHERSLGEVNALAGPVRAELRQRFTADDERDPCPPKCPPNCDPNCDPSKEGKLPGCPPFQPDK